MGPRQCEACGERTTDVLDFTAGGVAATCGNCGIARAVAVSDVASVAKEKPVAKQVNVVHNEDRKIEAIRAEIRQIEEMLLNLPVTKSRLKVLKKVLFQLEQL